MASPLHWGSDPFEARRRPRIKRGLNAARRGCARCDDAFSTSAYHQQASLFGNSRLPGRGYRIARQRALSFSSFCSSLGAPVRLFAARSTIRIEDHAARPVVRFITFHAARWSTGALARTRREQHARQCRPPTPAAAPKPNRRRRRRLGAAPRAAARRQSAFSASWCPPVPRRPR